MFYRFNYTFFFFYRFNYTFWGVMVITSTNISFSFFSWVITAFKNFFDIFNEDRTLYKLMIIWTYNVFNRNQSCHLHFFTGTAGEALPVNSERDVFEILEMEYRPPTERDLWSSRLTKLYTGTSMDSRAYRGLFNWSQN